MRFPLAALVRRHIDLLCDGLFICGCDCEVVMPKAAPRPCSYQACRTLVSDGSGRCSKHPRAAWVKVNPVKRITGRRLQAMRAKLFSSAPLCAECERQGRVTAATQRDHVIPLFEGGLDDESNEQGLCNDCHDVKSQAEAQRARRKTV